MLKDIAKTVIRNSTGNDANPVTFTIFVIKTNKCFVFCQNLPDAFLLFFTPSNQNLKNNEALLKP